MIIIAVRKAGASISETTTILGFSLPTLSQVWKIKKNGQAKKIVLIEIVNVKGESRVACTANNIGRVLIQQITTEFNTGVSQSIS